MTASVAPFDLTSTCLRLRPDASVESLALGGSFWQRMSAGELGNFHNEYLVTLHTYSDNWPQWEMHPNGDEVVCLISGAVDFVLGDDARSRTVQLRGAGEYVVVTRGTWHTARPLVASTLLFITAGEGTLHRAST